MEQKKDKTNIWIDIKTAAGVMGLSEQTLKKQCRAGEFVFKIVKKGKCANYFILLKSLPDFVQDKYFGETLSDIKYSEAPNWAKQQAEKYLEILENSDGLKGNDLKQFIEEWNNSNEPTSYSSVIKMRRRFFRYGLNGLLSRHGQHLKGSSVQDDYFEYFKNLYLIEGAPSLRTC